MSSSTRAGAAFGKLAQTTPRQASVPDPDSSGSRGATAPGSPGATVSREPVRRFTVRLYAEAEDDALARLRRQLRTELGRTPSMSDIARAAGIVAADQPDFAAALATYLRENPTRL